MTGSLEPRLRSRSDDGGQNDSRLGNTFVGSISSTVLFFLALAIGVFIALLFVFFTVRYFVRSKYGLQIYPYSNRNMFMVGRLQQAPAESTITTEELEDQINLIRNSDGLRMEILNRWLYAHSHNRAGRSGRMKKLSTEEVEQLFPKKSYYDWLNGGRERDGEMRDDILQEEKVEDVEEVDLSYPTEVTCDGVDSGNAYAKKGAVISKGVPLRILETEEESFNSEKCTKASHKETLSDELHFTSGSCAICLEVIENADTVRGLLCGHVFHADCIDPWLTKRRACCPMCKRNYYYRQDILEGNTGNSGDRGRNNGQSNNEDDSSGGNNDEGQVNNDDSDSLYNSRIIHSLESNSINIDSIRNDSALIAFIQDLIPLRERVRSILNNDSFRELNLEEEACVIAARKYGRFMKPMWWVIMGIKKADLFNWAVLKLYREHRAQIVRDTRRSSDSSDQVDNTERNTTALDSSAQLDSNQTSRRIIDNMV